MNLVGLILSSFFFALKGTEVIYLSVYLSVWLYTHVVNGYNCKVGENPTFASANVNENIAANQKIILILILIVILLLMIRMIINTW